VTENQDTSQKAMLEMAVREQRDTLKMHVKEVQHSPDAVTIGPAIGEVEALLVDVDQTYGFKE
jgi:hypothetical protein